MGISFSIPIDEAIRVSDQLRSSGAFRAGLIGVHHRLRFRRKWPNPSGSARHAGLVVSGVETGSPGDKAGIEPKATSSPSTMRKSSKTRATFTSRGQHQAGRQELADRVSQRQLARAFVTVAEIDPEKPTSAQPIARSRPARRHPRQRSLMGLVLSDLTDAAEKGTQGASGVRHRRSPAMLRREGRPARRRRDSCDQQYQNVKRQGIRRRSGQGRQEQAAEPALPPWETGRSMHLIRPAR
jgi:serine protease Do